MPSRPLDAPKAALTRYRERLEEEMDRQELSDRALSKRINEAGYPLSHTALVKTRTGTRQPTLDEALRTTAALGYRSLDVFMLGQQANRIPEAVHRFQEEVTAGTEELDAALDAALRALAQAMSDPAATTALSAAQPGWREEYSRRLLTETRWVAKRQVSRWLERLQDLETVLEAAAPPQNEDLEAMATELMHLYRGRAGKTNG